MDSKLLLWHKYIRCSYSLPLICIDSPLGSTTTFDVGLLGLGGILLDTDGAVAGGVRGGGGTGAVNAKKDQMYT